MCFSWLQCFGQSQGKLFVEQAPLACASFMFSASADRRSDSAWMCRATQAHSQHVAAHD